MGRCTKGPVHRSHIVVGDGADSDELHAGVGDGTAAIEPTFDSIANDVDALVSVLRHRDVRHRRARPPFAPRRPRLGAAVSTGRIGVFSCPLLSRPLGEGP